MTGARTDRTDRFDAIQQTLSDLQRSVGNVEGQLSGVGRQLNTFIAQMAVADTRATDLEVRTRKVENRQHWYSGVGAAIGMLLGAFGVHGIKT